MTRRAATRASRAAAVALICPVTIVFCVAVVDRPAATFAHAQFSGHDLAFRALTHLVDPLLPLAAFGLAGAALAGALGWRLPPLARLVLACCLAIALAFLFRAELKFAFGRLWPETWVENNPSWIRDGAYGFFPFHGGTGWSSFPSGHMMTITAPAAVLWVAVPRGRPLAAAAVLAVAVGLYGADFHFVGDMVAGLDLGAACGLGAWRLVEGGGGFAAAVPRT